MGENKTKKVRPPKKLDTKRLDKKCWKKEAGQKRCDRSNHGHQLFALGSVRLIDKRSGVLTRTCHLISSSSYFNWYLSYLSYTCCLIIDIKSITFFGWVLLGKCCFTCQKLNFSQTKLPTPHIDSKTIIDILILFNFDPIISSTCFLAGSVSLTRCRLPRAISVPSGQTRTQYLSWYDH